MVICVRNDAKHMHEEGTVTYIYTWYSLMNRYVNKKYIPDKYVISTVNIRNRNYPRIYYKPKNRS